MYFLRMNLYGNYAYIHARLLTGMWTEMNRLTPVTCSDSHLNTVLLWIECRIEIAGDISFWNPSFSYKTKIFFEDSNTPDWNKVLTDWSISEVELIIKILHLPSGK